MGSADVTYSGTVDGSQMSGEMKMGEMGRRYFYRQAALGDLGRAGATWRSLYPVARF